MEKGRLIKLYECRQNKKKTTQFTLCKDLSETKEARVRVANRLPKF